MAILPATFRKLPVRWPGGSGRRRSPDSKLHAHGYGGLLRPIRGDVLFKTEIHFPTAIQPSIFSILRWSLASPCF